MTTDEFNACSKEALLLAAKASFKSARSHYAVAEQAAAIEQYPIANSLTILAVEECIKSMILAAGYFSIKIPFDVEPFFRDHKTKHDQAAEIQPLLNKLWTVKDTFIRIFRDRQSTFGIVLNLGVAWMLTSIGLEKMPVKDFSAWWKNANKQKNNGFYVGFFNGKWVVPSEITKETYAETLSMAKPFIECLQVIDHIRADDYKIFLPGYKFPDSERPLLKLGDAGSFQEPDLSDYKPIQEN